MSNNDHLADINSRLERMEAKIDTVIETVSVTRERTAKLETKAALFGAIGGVIVSLAKGKLWP